MEVERTADAVARHFRRAKATLSERMAACRQAPEDRAVLGLPLERVVDEAIGLFRDRPPDSPDRSP